MFNELISFTVDLINTCQNHEALQKELETLVNDFEQYWKMIRFEQGLNLIPPEYCSEVKD